MRAIMVHRVGLELQLRIRTARASNRFVVSLRAQLEYSLSPKLDVVFMVWGYAVLHCSPTEHAMLWSLNLKDPFRALWTGPPVPVVGAPVGSVQRQAALL